MTHSDLKEMCRGYGLVVRHILDIDDEHLIYEIVPPPLPPNLPPAGGSHNHRAARDVRQ
jgi:hypothetical protein